MTKKEKMFINKERVIDEIIEDLKANEYESKDYIYELVRESLRTRTQADLKQYGKG